MKVVIKNGNYSTTISTNEKTGKTLLKKSDYAEMFLEKLNKDYETDYVITETEIIDITGKHVCKYCGEIAESEYEDLLCDECREIFGHALYSEL